MSEDRTTVTAVRINPEPTHEEAAAIVAAVQLGLPHGDGNPEHDDWRWRFSGRWWSKPVPMRRNRPG